MKKTLSVLFLIVLIVSGCCSAEDFSLHGGTQFGMTFEEVAAIEKPLLTDYSTAYPDGMLNNNDIDFYTSWNYAVFISGHDTVAKQKDTVVAFCFDANRHDDQLNQVMYFFDSENCYSFIEDALSDKYGVTDYTDVTGMSPSTFFVTSAGVSIFSFMGKNRYELNRYSHRVVDLGEEHYVIIQHILFHRYREAVHVLIYRDVPVGYSNALVNEYFSSALDDL